MTGRFLLSSIILLILSGCSTKEFHFGWYDVVLPSTVIEIKKVYPEIPKDELWCPSIPKPDNNITKQSQVANYIVDLNVAGKKCKSNLNYVRMLLIEFKSDNNISK